MSDVIEKLKAQRDELFKKFEAMDPTEYGADDLKSASAAVDGADEKIRFYQEKAAKERQQKIDETVLDAGDKIATDSFGSDARKTSVAERGKQLERIVTPGAVTDPNKDVFIVNFGAQRQLSKWAKEGADVKDIQEAFAQISTSNVKSIPDSWDGFYKPSESLNGVWSGNDFVKRVQPKAGKTTYPKITAYDNTAEGTTAIRVGEGSDSNEVNDMEGETVITIRRYGATVPLTDAVIETNGTVDRISEAGMSLMHRLTKSIENDLSGAQAAVDAKNGAPQGIRNFSSATVRDQRSVQTATSTGIAPGEWLAPMALLDFGRIEEGTVIYMMNNTTYINQYANHYSAQYGFTFPMANVAEMGVRGFKGYHNFVLPTALNLDANLVVFCGSLPDYYLVADSGTIEVKQDPFSKQGAGVVNINASIYAGGAVQDIMAGAWIRGNTP